MIITCVTPLPSAPVYLRDNNNNTPLIHGGQTFRRRAASSSERSTSTSEDPVTSLSASEVFQHITKTDEGFGITLSSRLSSCLLVFSANAYTVKMKVQEIPFALSAAGE